MGKEVPALVRLNLTEILLFFPSEQEKYLNGKGGTCSGLAELDGIALVLPSPPSGAAENLTGPFPPC